MVDRLPAGPYRTLKLDDGLEFPYYVIPFDKRGLCQGPETRRHLIEGLTGGDHSDVFLFSHGWNNDWKDATVRYEGFINGYQQLRREQKLPVPANYKPLLIGIFWPSTALVFGEGEKGPGFASVAAGSPDDTEVAAERREVDELASDLDPTDAEVLYRSTQKESLTLDEARELAAVALRLTGVDDDELGAGGEFGVDDLLASWAAATQPAGDTVDELSAGSGGGAAREAALSGFFSRFDPRQIVRALTVWQMKDRAGTVGARGVGPLLRDILANCTAKVHLVGHSYGAKVVLSATSFGGDLPRKVRSMLLLQPAVSHLCFAERVPGSDPARPGGYRPALARIDAPILSTYSDHDQPLTKLFHNAVRRDGDLGEATITAAPAGGGAPEPPSKYAALGGFGPRKAGEKLIAILDPGTAYNFEAGAALYGLNGTRTIDGHGDISVPSTWWALHSLAAR